MNSIRVGIPRRRPWDDLRTGYPGLARPRRSGSPGRDIGSGDGGSPSSALAPEGLAIGEVVPQEVATPSDPLADFAACFRRQPVEFVR